MNQCTDPVPEMKEKKISVTVPVEFETTQLSIQHVLLVLARTTRQIWRNLGGHRLEVGAGDTAPTCVRDHFKASLFRHQELKPRPTKHNNTNNALQRQHKPTPVTRHFREEDCQVTRKLECYELQPRPATRTPK